MKIHVLGNGITANAVNSKLTQLKYCQLSTLEEADYIIVSPGIPPSQYPQINKPIISEIELSVILMKSLNIIPYIIAVTGTNGKTTVTSLISHILDCPAVGNIGTTMISLIPENKQEEKTFPNVIVIELSSYQLFSTPSLKPNISIITNITEDHLSWHNTMENYINSKKNIFINQNKNDLFIYNINDSETLNFINDVSCRKQSFSSNDIFPLIKNNKNMPGKHNMENAICSFIACKEYGIEEKIITKKISSFPGVEHRLELITSYKNTPIYNDSKATNPEATITAINALGKNGVIILGGKDKHTSLEILASLLKENEIKIILIGEATERFSREFNQNGLKELHREKNMVNACKKALSLCYEKPYLLFSPACASFDMYSNFEERGRDFKKIIMEMTNE